MKKSAGEDKKTKQKEVKKTDSTESSSKKSVNKLARKVLPIVFLIAWIFISVIASQFMVGSIMLAIFGREAASGAVFTAVYSLISYILALILIVFVPLAFIKKWKTSREELGLTGLPTWTDIGLAPVGFIAALILAAGLVAVFSVFPWFNASEAQDVGFNAYVAGVDRIIAFITLVVLAPITEELIFRGFLYGKLRTRLGVVVSTLITSLVFAILHFQWNVGVNVFALSVVLCALREVTGTIYAGMLTHMIKNGVAFCLLYVLGI